MSQVLISAAELQAIARLRKTQSKYFATRSPYLLQECKKLEKKIDAFIEAWTVRGLIIDTDRARGEKPTTGNLFHNPKTENNE